jgi:Protein of unknown function (DUF3611)
MHTIPLNFPRRQSRGAERCSFVLLPILFATLSMMQMIRFPGMAVAFSTSPRIQHQRSTSIASWKKQARPLVFLSALSSAESNEVPVPFQQTDPIIRNAAKVLQRTSWISWWSQVILTVISSIILLFAKSVTTSATSNTPNFLLSAVGLCTSAASIIWTWGNGTRLSRRLLLRPITRNQVVVMVRRAITVGVTLNCVGLLCHLLAAQQIIGLLAIKVLTGRSSGLLLAAVDGSNTLQPLDILIVQANTNAILSQYISLVALLSLTTGILSHFAGKEDAIES